jgi:hypothetical protein
MQNNKLVRLLLSALVSVTVSPAVHAQAAPALSVSELPAQFKQTEQHDNVADDSGQFKRCGGVSSGLRVYQGPDQAALQRVVDMWWIFPNDAQAEKFLQASQSELSEGMPLVSNPPAVGDACKAFGGMVNMGIGDSFASWIYLFRRGRAVCKVYGAEGPTATKHPTLQNLEPIATAAAKHCDSYK